MKKIYTTTKFKRQNDKKSKKRLRRRLLSKQKKKLKNRNKQNKTKFQVEDEIKNRGLKRITPPKHFSFTENTNEVITFINKIEELYLSKKGVYIYLTDVTYLDYSSVTILLSVMFSFQARNIKFNGNFPKNRKLAEFLINSDFFKHLGKPTVDKIEYRIGKQNQIFTRANKDVDPKLGYSIMSEVSQTIWGEKKVCKGLQRILLELMQNTNNHATKSKKGEKHWWLSVNHNKKAKTVSFIFVDYGIGIFESLKNKPVGNKLFGYLQEIIDKFRYDGNHEVFKLLLSGQLHLTVTGESFRGKGLPAIKEVLDRNQISNLCIISNNVLAKVSNDEYSILESSFSGTFVYWELNENNINSKWITK